jgi:RNA polymerase sigma-70 factor (ECF subfamily)
MKALHEVATTGVVMTAPQGVVVDLSVTPAAPTVRLAVAFDSFYRSEYPAVVALAFALCGRAAMAEDVAQEAFMVTHQRWAMVADYEKPGAYVRRVAANLAVSQRRRLAAETRAKARLAVRAWTGAPDIEVPDPGFWRAVRSLPRRQAQVLALHYLEDKPAEEIGAILGCSASTVRVHLHRGRQALEQRLSGGDPS